MVNIHINVDINVYINNVDINIDVCQYSIITNVIKVSYKCIFSLLFINITYNFINI